MPVNPVTIDAEVKEDKEQIYVRDFQVMDSKNNDDRHRFEREYFDTPHAYLQQGFKFQSVYTKPHLLASASKMRSLTTSGDIESPLTLKTRTSNFSKGALNTLDPGSPYRLKNPEMLPVTNGLSEV